MKYDVIAWLEAGVRDWAGKHPHGITTRKIEDIRTLNFLAIAQQLSRIADALESIAEKEC